MPPPGIRLQVGRTKKVDSVICNEMSANIYRLFLAETLAQPRWATESYRPQATVRFSQWPTSPCFCDPSTVEVGGATRFTSRPELCSGSRPSDLHCGLHIYFGMEMGYPSPMVLARDGRREDPACGEVAIKHGRISQLCNNLSACGRKMKALGASYWNEKSARPCTSLSTSRRSLVPAPG